MGGPGSGGRNRKADSVHVLDGTYRRDRHDPPARSWGSQLPPNELASVPARLRWMSPAAKAFWRKYAPPLAEMAVLDRMTETYFSVLCETYSNWRRLEELVAKAHGDPPAVLVRQRRQASSDFRRFADDFGLTPLGRQRLGLNTLTPGDPDRLLSNPFAEFGGQPS